MTSTDGLHLKTEQIWKKNRNIQEKTKTPVF